MSDDFRVDLPEIGIPGMKTSTHIEGIVKFPRVCVSCGTNKGEFIEFRDRLVATEIRESHWFSAVQYYSKFERSINAALVMCKPCWKEHKKEEDTVVALISKKHETLKTIGKPTLLVTVLFWIITLFLFSNAPVVTVIVSFPLAAI